MVIIAYGQYRMIKLFLISNGEGIFMSEDDNKGAVFDVDRFLLFHPQSQLTYIRQLSMSYGYYTSLAVVDNDNRVTHVGVDNDFHIVAFKDLTDNDRNILGYAKCNHLGDEDLLSVYRINSVLKLSKPFRLFKGCRSMRYTTVEETYYLKKSILSTLDDDVEVVGVNKFDYYTDFYGERVSLDLNHLDFDLDKDLRELELSRFDELKASGQTRLL